MRGLEKYANRVAEEARKITAMAELHRAIQKRDAKRRRAAVAPPTGRACKAVDFADVDPEVEPNEVDATRAAVGLIDEGFVVCRVLDERSLLVAPRGAHTSEWLPATSVPLLLTNEPVEIFHGDTQCVALRLWKREPVPVYILARPDMECEVGRPVDLGLSAAGYAELQCKAAKLLGVKLS